ncbi:MAG: hypothetical protein FJY65_03410 [Calditrichaeota bacterium]|nr:hypothetical protein [Calditrichota bacterium]
MSLYHPNETSKTSKPNEPEVLPCPECGAEAMRRWRGECRLLDGFVIADLERWHCTACEEDFFDPQAMDKIAFLRKERSNSRLKLSKRVKEGNYV